MTKTLVIRTELKLPRDFRRADFLAFHARDQQQIAEQVDAKSLVKGFMWEQLPACLGIQFKRRGAELSLALDTVTDSKATPIDLHSIEEQLLARARHLLGLNQNLQGFCQNVEQHPQLGPLIRRQPGLRIPQAATPFEALTWAIIGQQISVAAAVGIRRKFILAAGIKHSSGLGCYPSAQQIVNLDQLQLKACGLSRSKALAIIALSHAVASGDLPLDTWLENKISTGHLACEELSELLLAVKGIGPWTLNYALMRGFGWLDGSLHGDVAVRRSLQQLLQLSEKPSMAFTQQWLTQFAPYRALVAAHLWNQATTGAQ